MEPKTEKLHIYSKFNLPRLGSIILATIMKNEGYETIAYFHKANELMNDTINADLIALSTITTTAPAAYKIADYYRNLGIPVVIGGPHVTSLPKEALEHADFCIRGEGEIPLPALVSALNNGTPLEDVPSLTWKRKGKIINNPLSRPIEDLDSLPYPDFNLLESGIMVASGLSPKPTIPIQTSRGCPFDCKFCSVTSMFGKRFRYRSVGNIINELKQYDPKKVVFFFYDDNFTANRRRTKDLLREIILHREEFGGKFAWSTQVRVDIAKDPELLDLMAEAGCNVLYIGFESVNPAALIEMKKSQTVKDMEWAIRKIHKRKIHIHGMFIFGFDADTIESTKSTVDFAIKQRIESTQFLILTPLPGTEFFFQMQDEGRLIDTKWEEYDTHHVKFKPLNFSPWELQQTQIYAHRRFYKIRYAFARLFRGKFKAFVIGLYANHLNKLWLVWEKNYMQWLKIYSSTTINSRKQLRILIE